MSTEARKKEILERLMLRNDVDAVNFMSGPAAPVVEMENSVSRTGFRRELSKFLSRVVDELWEADLLRRY